MKSAGPHCGLSHFARTGCLFLDTYYLVKCIEEDESSPMSWVWVLLFDYCLRIS